ncbi:peptidoglycan DD-metalloendopeptidase family protein [Catellatospora sp. KI3]|uniref:M23 family metallopeptidase n=1 Tax=Catellatospora sp. KI3 TaxID=3041620 RepID=UPI002482A9D9|nr:M23 family metallopeptidase [Catellatospora sp. KI3]MDI1460538.1 peptidoglycan DD-metalloendopeptidase family protein [Catellatospora sp. KI3]
MGWRRLVPVLLCAVALVLTGLPAFAAPEDPSDDMKRVDKELARTGALLESVSEQARTAARQLAETNAALPAAQERIAKARTAVVVAETKAATAQRRADAATAAWQLTDQRYQESVRQVRDGRDRMARFAVATMHGANLAEFNLLLAATRPQEFLIRGGLIRQLGEMRKDAIDGYMLARRDAKQVTNEAELRRRTAEEANRVAQATLQEAQDARAEAERAERDLRDLSGRREKALAAAEAEKADVQRRYEEVKQQSEEIAAQLRAWQEQYGQFVPVLRAGARLLMPTRGWKSSDYGMRFDPYYHTWQLHAGVDIAADGGQAIYAAAGGTVAAAGWNGGYGNYTCITHGRRDGQVISTCYGHQSKILVSVGQKVRGGQLIGRVGTTGASTGNHLHFEVRRDGEPIQPLNWLPGCLC